MRFPLTPFCKKSRDATTRVGTEKVPTTHQNPHLLTLNPRITNIK